MSRTFATGLVVGSFAPLHKGHELLIQRAREQCDHVIIVSYTNPEVPECPPERRALWLERLFPETTRLVFGKDEAPDLPLNSAPDDVHRHLVADLCINKFRRRVDAVFTSESYGPGFAEVLTKRFRAANLGTAPVVHVAVDPDRRQVPIRGSTVRSNLWLHWDAMSPAVSQTLVQRVALLGGESSGKSTLAAALASEFQTVCVPEYGRELWDLRKGKLEFKDLAAIATEQVRRETLSEAAARRFVFCDTSPLTTLFYSQHMFGRVAPELEQAAQRPYGCTILCEPDFEFVQDGTRQGSEFRLQQQAWYERELRARGITYLSIRGNLERASETST